jgi:tripartite-type tricarboxylate transporter receptor subunit TctC
MRCGKHKWKWSRRHAIGATLAGFLAMASSGAAAAPEYPNHAIRMIVAGAAGGASDTIARVLADKLTSAFGRAVIVDNRPGAGTMLASELLAAAPPDGYTIQFITNSHTINAAVRKNLRYDPIKDFAAVSLLATQPNLIVVSKDLPVNSLKELIALAKKEPGKLTFGSAGAGSASALAGELFKSVTGTDLLHVPYKGGTPALIDLMADRVQVLFFPLVDVADYARTGRVRALALTSDRRSPLAPEVPTGDQAGVPGIEAGAWYGVAAPAKTSPQIINVLNRAFVNALAAPDVQKRLAATGSEIIGSTPEYFATYMREDIARWQKLVEQKPELRVD